MLQNATDAMFDRVTFQGKPALLSYGRLDKTTLPQNLCCYDIRHSDYDLDKPCTLENKVVVNFYGSIITKEPIPLSSDGYLRIKPHDLDISGSKPMRLKDFLALSEKQLSIVERLKAVHETRRDMPKPQKKTPVKGGEER